MPYTVDPWYNANVRHVTVQELYKIVVNNKQHLTSYLKNTLTRHFVFRNTKQSTTNNKKET